MMTTMLGQLPIAVGGLAQIWYAAPLIVAISLVFGATRHEHLKEIVMHSFKAAFFWLLLLGGIFALVWWGTTNV